MGSRKVKNMDTVDKIDKPDYYNMSKPKSEVQKLQIRKCYRCGKEKKMGKFERYCSIACGPSVCAMVVMNAVKDSRS